MQMHGQGPGSSPRAAPVAHAMYAPHASGGVQQSVQEAPRSSPAAARTAAPLLATLSATTASHAHLELESSSPTSVEASHRAHTPPALSESSRPNAALVRSADAPPLVRWDAAPGKLPSGCDKPQSPAGAREPFTGGVPAVKKLPSLRAVAADTTADVDTTAEGQWLWGPGDSPTAGGTVR